MEGDRVDPGDKDFGVAMLDFRLGCGGVNDLNYLHCWGKGRGGQF